MKRSIVVLSALSFFLPAAAKAEDNKFVDGAKRAGAKVVEGAEWVIETSADWHQRQISRFPIRVEEVSIEQALKELSPQVAEGVGAIGCIVVGSKLRGAQVPAELKPGNTLAERTEFAGKVVEDHMRALETKLDGMELKDIKKLSASETVSFPINEYIAYREAQMSDGATTSVVDGYRKQILENQIARGGLQIELQALEKAAHPSGPAAEGALKAAKENLTSQISRLETAEGGLRELVEQTEARRPNVSAARQTFRQARGEHARVAGGFTLEALEERLNTGSQASTAALNSKIERAQNVAAEKQGRLRTAGTRVRKIGFGLTAFFVIDIGEKTYFAMEGRKPSEVPLWTLAKENGAECVRDLAADAKKSWKNVNVPEMKMPTSVSDKLKDLRDRISGISFTNEEVHSKTNAAPARTTETGTQ